ncbi:unnamed protein product [Rotaria socialis]|uniref:Uncharacterized protein n=1 Tax=Rotaria socialis TaxID=392032 RepID=A0A817U8P1_9BILA|nr:unnamed protein product [Rotaria socialis]CAF3332328.1 unnamed protein product [Rotaria socialis]CAF3374274.1 unnamed protein product [Rotaria socialis]CAF3577738.1 unnamed protein product [Rotaria socialis]CAF3666252.1 unnamed protein product [Rotaria socialis]
MKLWCMLVIFLIFTISTSFVYTEDSHATLNLQDNINENPSNTDLSSTTLMEQKRSIVKRSQRNANILYRYCRQSGQARQFCLKYAVQMLYATGH